MKHLKKFSEPKIHIQGTNPLDFGTINEHKYNFVAKFKIIYDITYTQISKKFKEFKR